MESISMRKSLTGAIKANDFYHLVKQKR